MKPRDDYENCVQPQSPNRNPARNYPKSDLVSQRSEINISLLVDEDAKMHEVNTAEMTIINTPALSKHKRVIADKSFVRRRLTVGEG